VGSIDIWGIIHAERKALADDLQGLTEPQWATQSLCTAWTVHDVLAHMTATARMTSPQFIGKFVMSGFNFASVQAQGVAAEKGSSPADTLARFTALVNASNHPPGPNDTWLGEVIVHSEDIRRALHIKHAYPIEAAMQVANFYKNSNLLIGAKTRITGLKLRATDADWSNGDGPEVAGPMVSLVVAMAGRKAATEDLVGDGVPILRARR